MSIKTSFWSLVCLVLASFGLLVSVTPAQAQSANDVNTSTSLSASFGTSLANSFSTTSLASSSTGTSNPSTTQTSAPATSYSAPAGMGTNTAMSMSSSSSMASVDGNMAAISSDKVTGEVLKIDNSEITIDAGGTKKFSINNAQAIKITRDGAPIALSDIKPRDQVTITYGASNEVLAVEALSSQNADMLKWLIAGLILFLIAAAIGYYLWKKSQEGHIKTTTSAS